MREKEIEFSVKMTPVEIFRFTMYHSRHKISGLVGIALSLIALVILITSFGDLNDQDRAVLILVAAWFTILEPLTLWFRAKGQVKRSKVYQQPLAYRFDQNGITVSQNEEQQTIGWENLVKIVETKTQFLVYSSRIHAFIFPKKAMGDQLEEARAMLSYYAGANHIEVKGALKKFHAEAEQDSGE